MPRLVVLNSCSGAAAGVNDLFSGMAAALVRGGVSAVAAMQYEISAPAAVAFARGFYAAIARGRGVDDAVSSGRVAILGLSDRTLEWVTPVLYLRGHDARLFTLQAPAEDRDREGADSIRGGQPGDTISPGAAGGPRGDGPAGQAGARVPPGEDTRADQQEERQSGLYLRGHDSRLSAVPAADTRADQLEEPQSGTGGTPPGMPNAETLQTSAPNKPVGANLEEDVGANLEEGIEYLGCEEEPRRDQR